jgi:hypothetical protein
MGWAKVPQFNRRELDLKAREYGYNRDMFEKVYRLKETSDGSVEM